MRHLELHKKRKLNTNLVIAICHLIKNIKQIISWVTLTGEKRHTKKIELFFDTKRGKRDDVK